MTFDYAKFKAGYHDLCKEVGAHPENGISQYQAANHVATKHKEMAWADYQRWWDQSLLWANPGLSEPLSVRSSPLSQDEDETARSLNSRREKWWQNHDYWVGHSTFWILRKRPTEDLALTLLERETRGLVTTIEQGIAVFGLDEIAHILKAEFQALFELDRALNRPPAYVKEVTNSGQVKWFKNRERDEWRWRPEDRPRIIITV